MLAGEEKGGKCNPGYGGLAPNTAKARGNTLLLQYVFRAYVCTQRCTLRENCAIVQFHGPWQYLGVSLSRDVEYVSSLLLRL